MSVTPKDIERAAKLSALKISEEDYELFMCRISRVFEWVETLQEIDTKGIAPLANPLENFPEMIQEMQKDRPHQTNTSDDILKEAPGREFNMFKVKKVIE